MTSTTGTVIGTMGADELLHGGFAAGVRGGTDSQQESPQVDPAFGNGDVETHFHVGNDGHMNPVGGPTVQTYSGDAGGDPPPPAPKPPMPHNPTSYSDEVTDARKRNYAAQGYDTTRSAEDTPASGPQSIGELAGSVWDKAKHAVSGVVSGAKHMAEDTMEDLGTAAHTLLGSTPEQQATEAKNNKAYLDFRVRGH